MVMLQGVEQSIIPPDSYLSIPYMKKSQDGFSNLDN
jgi:hypothetical protein